MPRRLPARFSSIASLAALACCLLPTIGVSGADDARGAPSRKPSYAIDPAAEAFVGKFDRAALLKDEEFIRALGDLAKSGLSAEAKADAFALMQRQIGWLFTGAARLFPGQGYAQTQAQVLSTFFGYQEALPKGLDVAALLDLARKDRSGHPLRASNALLLATILNHDASRDVVRKAIDLEAIRSAPVPAIDLHNLSLAAALVRDRKAVSDIVTLLPDVSSEESREDLIVATTIYRDEELRKKLEQFVRARFPASFDNSVQTALIVLAQKGPRDHFRDFYKSLGDLTKEEKDIKLLRDFWDSGFRDRLTSDDPAKSPLKIWDGFLLNLEQDGAWISYGDSYRAWISFK